MIDLYPHTVAPLIGDDIWCMLCWMKFKKGVTGAGGVRQHFRVIHVDICECSLCFKQFTSISSMLFHRIQKHTLYQRQLEAKKLRLQMRQG